MNGDDIRDRMIQALKSSTADYAEMRVEDQDHTAVSFRGKEPDRMGTSATRGGIVRACTRGGWGVAVFDSMENLDERVREACRYAALAGRETTQLAETPVAQEERPATMENDFRGVALDDKIALTQRYNTILLEAHEAVETSSVSYTEQFRTVRFASTRGTWFMEERPRVVMALAATARDGALVQRAHESVGAATGYDIVLGLEEKARATGRRAADLLKAPKAEGGPVSVVLNPLLAAVFIHEAFGHLSEADFLYENPRMRDLLQLDREIGAPELNVYDHGAWPRSIGSLSFDDEGTPTGKTALIRNGRVAGHLHSRETAAKMDEAPTGNARAVGRRHAPIVRMTNTYIDNGTADAAALTADLDRGYYACDYFGGQTQFEMFTFSSAYAYRIENGQKGELVRDLTLSGNLFETLRAIDGIANDMRLFQGGGGCGKGGQMPLPVGLGAPHIRIRNLVAGGA
jgi:TldD protein